MKALEPISLRFITTGLLLSFSFLTSPFSFSLVRAHAVVANEQNLKHQGNLDAVIIKNDMKNAHLRIHSINSKVLQATGQEGSGATTALTSSDEENSLMSANRSTDRQLIKRKHPGWRNDSKSFYGSSRYYHHSPVTNHRPRRHRGKNMRPTRKRPTMA